MKQVVDSVKVTLQDARTGEDKTESSPVTYPIFENAEDVLNYCDDKKLAQLLEWVNSGANQLSRYAVRQSLLAKMEGPDKAINKLISDLMKAREKVGKPISEQKAHAIAIAMLDSEEAVTA